MTTQRSRWLAILWLSALTVTFFWKIALTNLILVGVDIFTYFYPYRATLNEALSTGHLPLWNPDLFMGVPLLANAQVGVFYPLNWLFISLPAPQAINYSIVLHVWFGGIFCYVFARDSLKLSIAAASLNASIFALSGYVGSLVEHVNQLQAAAWFPLLLWSFDRALTTPLSLKFSQRTLPPNRFSLLSSAIFALQLLAGHAQVSFISLIALGVWGLSYALHTSPSAFRPSTSIFQFLSSIFKNIAPLRNLRSPLFNLLLLLLFGLALSAMQLLPMLELSRLSIRGGGLTYREVVAFSLPPDKLLVSLLPTYGFGEPLFSEYVAFVGISSIALIAMGLRSTLSNLKSHAHLSILLLLIVGFALALGVYNPLYYVLYKLVPGFGLFRVPARWLFLCVFALAALAGIGLDALQINSQSWARLPRRIMLILGLGSFVALIVLIRLRWLASPSSLVWLIWGATMLAVVVLLSTRQRLPPSFLRLAFSVIIGLELFIATRSLPYNQPTAPEAYSALRPAIAFLKAQSQSQPFRVLSYSDLTWDPGDLGDIRAMFAGQLSSTEIYQYTVAIKAKEILAPNLALRYHLPSVDGYDGGVLPLARFVGLQRLFLAESQVNPDGRLRERLRAMPEARWLDLFNVRYIIADKIFDVWVDGIYYDLGLGLTLNANDARPYNIPVPTDFEATAIGVISYLQGGARLPTGAPVAELFATDGAGQTHRFIVRAGYEVAESAYAASQPAHADARAVRTLRDQPHANAYHALFQLPAPTRLRTLQLRALHNEGTVFVQGLSLIHAPSTTSQPLIVAPTGQWRIAQSGDIKLYERLDVAPRAQVIHHSEVIADDALALPWMRDPAFDPRQRLVLAAGKTLQSDAAPTEAIFQSYTPERIVLTTNDPNPGYLLLKDTWYPGWRAWVDGQPASIERANTYFRALYVSGGSHTIELRYEPESLQSGLYISAAAIVTYLTLWLWVLRAR